jgi:hypothetical protein
MEQTPQQIEIIKKDAIIQIKFRPDFYQRLLLVLKSTYDGKTEQDLEEAVKQIESKQIKEEWIANYETMLYLIKASVDYAKANNMVEMVDIASLSEPDTSEHS